MLVLSQMATSQGFLRQCQLPKLKLPKSVLAVALGPLAHPSRRHLAPHYSLRRLRGPNLNFRKLPLGKLHIWEVTTQEIVT